MILVEHDTDVVMEIIEHVVALDSGKKATEGTLETSENG
jgi:ABC-type branched-subunit amino acid transport system ATPase component